MQIKLNMSIRNENVPEIDRLNSTTKECIWLVCMELIRLYVCIPLFLICKLVYDVTFWLNSIPEEDDVSATIIPRAIITGQYVEFRKTILLEFGEYVHHT